MKTKPDLPAPAGEPTQQADRLREVIGLFLRLGFTAFGGPAAHIALMREEVVRRRKWVTDERFVDLMGVANLIPGPTSTEVAIYLGYVRAGWQGLIVAGVCFIGPAMLIVLALAWLYVTYGALPQVGWLFYGIQPIVIAIVAQAIWNLRRAILKDGVWPVALLVGIVALYIAGVNVLVLLVGGALISAAVFWFTSLRKRPSQVNVTGLLPLLTNGHPILHGLTVASAGVAAAVSLPALFLTFLKFGAIIYGSGYVLLAFLKADLVQNLHWLTDQQLLQAIAIGQVTPGPVFTTATFIGYVVAGIPGAIVATVGIFAPSFALIALVHPIAARLRQFALTAALLDGVNVAALGLMAGVLIQLGQAALIDPVTWALALVALGLLVRFKINATWLIALGALVGIARFTLFPLPS